MSHFKYNTNPATLEEAYMLGFQEFELATRDLSYPVQRDVEKIKQTTYCVNFTLFSFN